MNFIMGASPSLANQNNGSQHTREYKSSNCYKVLRDYTVVDIETTDKNPNNCEIIEVAAVRVRGGKIVDQYQSLVKPSGKVPALIQILTGITNDMLTDAPAYNIVIRELSEFIGNDAVVGHNVVSFDACVLYDYFTDVLGKPFANILVDTLYFARKCRICPENYKLTTIAECLGITYDAHRALNDCIANHQVYERLKELFDPNSIPAKSDRPRSRKMHRINETTRSLSELSDIIKGIVADGKLTDQEICCLQEWMEDNDHLAGNFPFDSVFEKLREILADGIVTDAERQELLTFLLMQADPVENRSSAESADFCGKKVCLTGEFARGTREEITSLFENAGAKVMLSVSSKTDFLIVGGEGSADWSCGNYGTKVKKALELQNSGAKVCIMREEDALKCLV